MTRPTYTLTDGTTDSNERMCSRCMIEIVGSRDAADWRSPPSDW